VLQQNLKANPSKLTRILPVAFTDKGIENRRETIIA